MCCECVLTLQAVLTFDSSGGAETGRGGEQSKYKRHWGEKMRKENHVPEEPLEETEHGKTKLEKARRNICHINNSECNNK